MKKYRMLIVALAFGSLPACSEMQQIPMNQAQTDAYNQCMSTHWSSLADSVLFGVAGYEYHQNQVLNCQQVALTKGNSTASSSAAIDQPAQAMIKPAAPSN